MELMKIDYNSQQPTVLGRDLHEFLEITERYGSWFERMLNYGFENEVDFTSVKSFTLVNNGAERELQDHQLTIDMAKEISMLQRNEKGKLARQYFINLEKEWNSPEKVMARALILAQKTIETQKTTIEILKPKAQFFDTVVDSKSAIEMSQVAKLINRKGLGRTKLFEFLRREKVLRKNNEPYQEFIDRGYFRTIETKYTKPNGDININIKTLVLQKGIDYIIKLLDKNIN